MPTPKKKTATKSETPAEKPKSQVKFSCTVIQDYTKIGAMICLRGTQAKLPEDKAKALESLGKVRIDGIA